MESYFSTVYQSSEILAVRSENIVEPGFLSESELSLFFRLIRNRRSLPVYRDGFWGCYECSFESMGLGTMVMHIMGAHKPAPRNDEDVMDGGNLTAG